MNYIIYYTSALKRIYKNVEKRITSLEKELKLLPEGSMHLRKRSNGVSCYVSHKGCKKSVPLKSDITRFYARKRFAVRELTILKELDVMLKALLQDYANLADKENSGTFSCEKLLEIFGSVELETTGAEREWIEKTQSLIEMRPGDKVYLTDAEFKVRSKSERVIANMLHRFGILFVYEPELIIGGESFCPDFIIRLFDDRVVIWEHFGLMDNESYRKHAEYKIEKYKQVGFNQHTNLICTYEEDMEDERIIERIVRDRLCRV